MTGHWTRNGADGRALRVLITGGAGFIGSHMADRLVGAGHAVRVLDNLSPQVHGGRREPPEYLHAGVEFVGGDVRDRRAVERAVDGVDVVYHLAAAVGVGQSMYEIEHYTSVNAVGTAVLLEVLRERAKPVRRLVVASSMSVYGEGLYRAPGGAVVEDARRDEAAARQGRWECEAQGGVLEPVATPEWKRPSLASVYALSKYEQEQKCLIWGRAYDVPVVALRFFNAYGPRQALSNPYTGVIAIFASRLLNTRAPVIFEDGNQRRDFVSVYDVAAACELAATAPRAAGEVLNIGSGESVSVREVASALGRVLGVGIEPEVSGEFRAGDIRHCFADISRAREVLGYEPAWTLARGMEDLAGWLREQTAVDGVDAMREEMRRKGVTRGRGGMAGAGASPPGRWAQGAEPGNGHAGGNGHAASNGRVPEEAPRRNGAHGREPARVLVTGGCGFVGVNAVRRLARAGQRVRVLDNCSRAGSRENGAELRRELGSAVEVVEADVRDPASVREAVRGVERVLHLAAQVAVTCSLADPVADFETNVRGTLNVLEALRAEGPGAHLIFASTNKVYGDLADLALERDGGRYRPSDPVAAARGVGERPLSFHSPYGCSKGAADQYVLDYARSFGMTTTVCRMSCIYGVRQRGTEDQGWVAHFVRAAVRGEPITVYGDGCQVRDLLYVADLIDAYEAIWANPRATSGRAFNVGGGPERAVSLLELLERLEAMLGRSIEVDFEPWRTGDQRYYVSDTSALRTAVGWSPKRSLDEGLELLHGWVERLERPAQRNGRVGIGAALAGRGQ